MGHNTKIKALRKYRDIYCILDSFFLANLLSQNSQFYGQFSWANFLFFLIYFFNILFFFYKNIILPTKKIMDKSTFPLYVQHSFIPPPFPTSRNLIRACLDWGGGRGVERSRLELVENSLILGQFYFTLLYFNSSPSPSIQTDH